MKLLALFMVPLVMLQSCAPSLLYPTTGAALGGGIAGIASDGKPLYTALGAVAGGVAGAYLYNSAQKGRVAQYNKGYDQGAIDNTHALKEAQENLQKFQEPKSQEHYHTISVPAPVIDSEGIRHVDTDLHIRVED